MEPRYVAFYCEENVYRLAEDRSAAAGGDDAFVVLVSNAERAVALTAQRAGRGDAAAVVWDYHAIYAEGELIFDLDSLLGFPLEMERYEALTFPRTGDHPLAPRFSAVPAPAYLEAFSSDRSHMLGADGRYLEPPPAWPAIYDERVGNTLFALVDGHHPAVAAHGAGLAAVLRRARA